MVIMSSKFLNDRSGVAKLGVTTSPTSGSYLWGLNGCSNGHIPCDAPRATYIGKIVSTVLASISATSNYLLSCCPTIRKKTNVIKNRFR